MARGKATGRRPGDSHCDKQIGTRQHMILTGPHTQKLGSYSKELTPMHCSSISDTLVAAAGNSNVTDNNGSASAQALMARLPQGVPLAESGLTPYSSQFRGTMGETRGANSAPAVKQRRRDAAREQARAPPRTALAPSLSRS